MKKLNKALKEYFHYKFTDRKPFLVWDSKSNKYFVTILFSKQMIRTYTHFEIII